MSPRLEDFNPEEAAFRAIRQRFDEQLVRIELLQAENTALSAQINGLDTVIAEDKATIEELRAEKDKAYELMRQYTRENETFRRLLDGADLVCKVRAQEIERLKKEVSDLGVTVNVLARRDIGPQARERAIEIMARRQNALRALGRE